MLEYYVLNQNDRNTLSSNDAIIEKEIIQQKILKRINKMVSVILPIDETVNQKEIRRKALICEIVKFISFFYDGTNGEFTIADHISEPEIFVQFWDKSDEFQYVTIGGHRDFIMKFVDVLQEINISIDSKVLVKAIFEKLGSVNNEYTQFYLK